MDRDDDENGLVLPLGLSGDLRFLGRFPWLRGPGSVCVAGRDKGPVRGCGPTCFPSVRCDQGLGDTLRYLPLSEERRETTHTRARAHTLCT